MWAWLGIQPRSPKGEVIVATIGGIVSIASISGISYLAVGVEGSLAIVPAMGAATVLLFCVPHGPLSQPWALFAGNIISAFIGVTCAILIPELVLAAALAVGLAIGAMYLLRCLHPPGGATALAAVIGGESIQQLGYNFVFMPVLANCIVIFFMAMLFNSFFPWRRYPLSLMPYRPAGAVQLKASKRLTIARENIVKGINDLGMVVDISAQQVEKILEAAQGHQDAEVLNQFQFELGGVYSNNRPGLEWEVRKIIDHADHPDPAHQLIIYRTIDGANKGRSDSCTQQEFAEWAQQKLTPLNE